MYNNNILETNDKISEKELNDIENAFGFTFPAEVKEHYLNYNGGYPQKNVWMDNEDNSYTVDWFIPIREDGEYKLSNTLNLLRDDNVIPNWLVPFADDEGGNLFCFSIKPEEEGAVYYYDHEFDYGEPPEEHIVKLCPSFKNFINLLQEENDDDL